METIQLLELCREKIITIKKAFRRLGMTRLTDGQKRMEDLTEEETFAFLLNWIINEMPKDERVTIRYRVEQTTYEITFRTDKRQLKVNKPLVISTDKSFCMYNWQEQDTYNDLTAEKINQSVQPTSEDKQKEETSEEEIWELLNQPCSNITPEELEEIEELLQV